MRVLRTLAAVLATLAFAQFAFASSHADRKSDLKPEADTVYEFTL